MKLGSIGFSVQIALQFEKQTNQNFWMFDILKENWEQLSVKKLTINLMKQIFRSLKFIFKLDIVMLSDIYLS